MALGIRGANPIWVLVNLAGKLFDDTYYMWVLENQIPYIPADVYHDPDLNTPWTDPIQFLGNGTLPNDVYFEPGVVYRLEFRQSDGLSAPTQQDPLIYLVENYVAGEGGSTPVDTVAFASSNQVTNPQFALTDFVSPFTLAATDPAPIEIGPGWFLNLAGTGTVTLTKVPLNNANPNPSNAPYALEITMSGWTADSVFLTQRFQQNGMLWANKIVSTAITARVQGLNVTITATLVDSNNSTLGQLLSTTVDNSFNEYTGYAQLGATTNPDVPPAAYIDYKLALPSNVDIYLSSIQLVVQDVPVEPAFEQDSVERQIDHTFHYYKNKLIQKPIPSYLVGWDFSFNPCQALGKSVSPVILGAPNFSRYVADQTILFSSIDNSIGQVFNNGGVNFSTSVDSSFAIVQYLDGATVLELLEQRMAVQLQGFANTSIPCVIDLYWTADTNLPSIPSGLSLVSGVSATGVQTVGNGTWNKVPRSNGLGDAAFNLLPIPAGASVPPTYPFSGWDATANSGINTATYFAIVVSFGTLVAANQIVLRYVSLCGGDIATRPAPLTLDQTLFQCQHYYETNYPLSGPASGANANGVLLRPLTNSIGITSGGAINSYGIVANSFGIEWMANKRRQPTVTLTSQAGTAANVSLTFRFNNVTVGPANMAVGTYWTSILNGNKGIAYQVTQTNFVVTESANPTGNLTSWITFNYVADARLGIVN